jgi:uncharacterized protein (TIGR02246 family)
VSEDEKAIRALVETWFAATRAGDVGTVLSLMADDVVFMVPGQEPFGKEQFAAASDGMSGMKIDGVYDIQEIGIIGEWAYLRNHIRMSMSLPGQDAPMNRSGYTLTLLRKEADGQWRLARDANLLAEDKRAT